MQIFAELAGGLALFLYGMHLAGEGLRRLAGGKLGASLRLVTRKRLLGVVAGAFVTFCLQSSSAATVFLVSLVEAGIVQFAQTLGMILGAGIGTTLTVQIIAFPIRHWSLLLIVLGIGLKYLPRRSQYRRGGDVILGFGFIFFGMILMRQSAVGLEDSPSFSGILLSLTSSPFLLLLATAAFTAVVQSSAAAIGLALVFASSGLLGTGAGEVLETSIPIIFGANIGTCATALLASLGVGRRARRVAYAHLVIKILGVLIFFPFVRHFALGVAGASRALLGVGVGVERMIANAHLAFNVLIALILLPFLGLIASALIRIFPSPAGEVSVGKLRRDSPLLKTPTVALREARGQVEALGEIVQGMLKDALRVHETHDARMLEEIRAREQEVDRAHRGITVFLTSLAQENLSPEESQRGVLLLRWSNALESVADLIAFELLHLSERLISAGLSFSFEGAQEINELHARVESSLEEARGAFSQNTSSLAQKIVRDAEEVRRLIGESYVSHMGRRQKELPETMKTSSTHLHVLSALGRVQSEIAAACAFWNDLGEEGDRVAGDRPGGL